MLMHKDDGTSLGGEADVMCILKLPTGRFHVAYLEECPMPGPVKPIGELSFIRLKSKMHHTGGSDTFEGAQEHLKELRAKIDIPDTNVLNDVAIEADNPVLVWIVKNWTTGQVSIKDALTLIV